MWAPDCAFKNGKYYFYFPSKDKTGGFRIGVAISTNPAGPFIPEANYIQGTSGTDPCCFIDDDGVAYLYFGSSKVARLKDNMIELDETPRTVNYRITSYNVCYTKLLRAKATFEKYKMVTFPDRVDYCKVNGNPDSTMAQFNEFLNRVPKGKPFFLQTCFRNNFV